MEGHSSSVTPGRFGLCVKSGGAESPTDTCISDRLEVRACVRAALDCLLRGASQCMSAAINADAEDTSEFLSSESETVGELFPWLASELLDEVGNPLLLFPLPADPTSVLDTPHD